MLQFGDEEGDDFVGEGEALVNHRSLHQFSGAVDPTFGFAGGGERNAIMIKEVLAISATKAFFKIGGNGGGTSHDLVGQFPPGSAVYVIGAKGLHDAISARGFHILSVADVHLEAKSSAPITAAAVVAGFSPNMTYQDVAMGAHLINQGVPFIGTNPDATYPTEIGPMPGAGATLAMLIAATGVQPTIIGKPGPVIFQEAVERLGGDPSAVAMVGDRLSTDIQGAKAAGLPAILVLSGISTREEAETGPVRPDYIFADITELAAFLTQERAVAH